LQSMDFSVPEAWHWCFTQLLQVRGRQAATELPPGGQNLSACGVGVGWVREGSGHGGEEW
jgi:hypothetical protein